MRSFIGREGRILGIFLLSIALSAPAFAEEGIARISEFSGDVSIQRGEEVVKPVRVGKMIRNGLLLDADMVQTQQKSTASVLFEDGSILKLQPETMIVINPPVEQVKEAAAEKVVERRVRIVVGKLWTFIEPKATAKTVFELPDGVAAVRGCAGRFAVSWNGSYSLQVTEGTFIPKDFRAGLGWEQNAGADVRVDRVPGGIRISNAAGSLPITLNFLLQGLYQLAADQGGFEIVDADGNKHTLQQGQGGSFNLLGAGMTLPPGCSITIIMKRKGRGPIGQLAGLAPFPYQTLHNASWRLGLQQPGGWLTHPIYYSLDDRRDPRLSDNRFRRSIFDRRLNQGTVRGGTVPHCSSGSVGYH